MTTAITTTLRIPQGTDFSATVTLPTGATRRWKKAHGVLRDSGERHALGVQVYFRAVGNGALELAVRWHNGLVQPTGPSIFCGRIYFDELWIRCGDPDLSLIAEQRAGALYDPNSGRLYVAHGGKHVFRPRGIMERRFLLAPKAMSQAEVKGLISRQLGFRGVRLKANGEEWGPAREPVCSINRQHYSQVFGGAAARLAGQVVQGMKGRIYGPNNWPLADITGAFGPYVLDGDPQPGAPAGYEIDLSCGGWMQTAEALELASIQHECSMARNPIAAYDIDTGEPISCHDWSSSESGRPQIMANGKLELPIFCKPGGSYPNFNTGSCPYQQALENYSADDLEHVIRAADDAMQLAYTAGDAMALDDLRMMFEHHRSFTFNDRSDAMQVSWSGYSSLTKDLKLFAANPHQGNGRFLRQWGWMLTLGVFVREATFCRKMIECALLARDACGILERRTHPEMANGRVSGTQHFHTMIDWAAVLRAARFLDDPVVTDRVLDAVSLWRDRVLKQWPIRKWLGRPNPAAAVQAGDWYGGPFIEHCLVVIGLAAQCEIDAGNDGEAKDWLDAGLKIGTPHADLAARLQWLNGVTGDMSQVASYKAAIEDMT